MPINPMSATLLGAMQQSGLSPYPRHPIFGAISEIAQALAERRAEVLNMALKLMEMATQEPAFLDNPAFQQWIGSVYPELRNFVTSLSAMKPFEEMTKDWSSVHTPSLAESVAARPKRGLSAALEQVFPPPRLTLSSPETLEPPPTTRETVSWSSYFPVVLPFSPLPPFQLSGVPDLDNLLSWALYTQSAR
jgi:hypothetical protein